MKGYYAFLDYAVAKWSHHFCAVINSAEALLEANKDTEKAKHEITEALYNFTLRYNDDLNSSENEATADGIPPGFPDSARRMFEEFGYGIELVISVWLHVEMHQRKAPNDVSLKNLETALELIRASIEEQTSNARLSIRDQSDLDSFYGEKRYKCSKLTCFYFNEGLADAKARDMHVDRHNRPFRCDVAECPSVDIGFTSTKQLDDHKRQYHLGIEDQAKSFPEPPSTPKNSKWICPKCNKSFTRNLALQSHLLAHNGERPFECSHCGKAFTRQNDCTRHERIHRR